MEIKIKMKSNASIIASHIADKANVSFGFATIIYLIFWLIDLFALPEYNMSNTGYMLLFLIAFGTCMIMSGFIMLKRVAKIKTSESLIIIILIGIAISSFENTPELYKIIFSLVMTIIFLFYIIYVLIKGIRGMIRIDKNEIMYRLCLEKKTIYRRKR